MFESVWLLFLDEVFWDINVLWFVLKLFVVLFVNVGCLFVDVRWLFLNIGLCCSICCWGVCDWMRGGRLLLRKGGLVLGWLLFEVKEIGLWWGGLGDVNVVYLVC